MADDDTLNPDSNEDGGGPSAPVDLPDGYRAVSGPYESKSELDAIPGTVFDDGTRFWIITNK